MSSLPGLTLEDYLQWLYGIVVDNDFANTSLAIAERLGTIKPRPRRTVDQFKPLVALFEPHRAAVERRLEDFDEENQSWRDYASCAFEFISNDLYNEGQTAIFPPFPDSSEQKNNDQDH